MITDDTTIDNRPGATTPMRVYILGPMRGIPHFNYKAFDSMAARINSHTPRWLVAVSPADMDRQAGFDPYSLPADYDWTKIPPGMKLDDIIARDVLALRTCEAYVCLPGWENSVGARAEKGLLDWQQSLRLHPEVLEPMMEPAETNPVLKENPNPVLKENPNPEQETRITDPKTGGQKGQKLARFDLIPSEPLWELAEVYGRGARKYADDNWRKGYSWRLSFGALCRHLHAWWMGEKRDELGNHHLAQVAWHAFTLFTFEQFNLGTDDRPLQPRLAVDERQES